MTRGGNRYTQIFATDYNWSCSFLIKLKSKAHKASSLLFHWGGVLPDIVYDNAKETIHVKFNRKIKEASCHSWEMEPFTSWSNAATREMKEQKKGSGKKLIKSSTPKKLWDGCLELESYIRSNTAHGISKLDGDMVLGC